MKIKLYNHVIITLPSGQEIQMTQKDFCQLHEDLTIFYNENFDALTKDND